MTKIRKGQAPGHWSRTEFGERFRRRFYDPAFRAEDESIARLEAVAWDAYRDGRKSPVTKPGGKGFSDPVYPISVEWLETRKRLKAAQKRWDEPSTQSRVLIICGSARNDRTCPGENSKSWRLADSARRVIEREGAEADLLDLSLTTSQYGTNIHPCKGCASTAMPLCHWPCSCYPNHSLGQAEDWMAEIYERWVAAHGVIIVTPTYWYQSPSPLKLMIDRLVCADGGNPDPSSTHGKTVSLAKELEQKGWDYPKHLAGRVYGVVVHGDVAGVESHCHSLGDCLSWMGLIAAGSKAALPRYLGYYEPYYNSHDTLDRNLDLQHEVRNVALSVAHAVKQMRAGNLKQPDRAIAPVRPK
jgi:multimeric flavodoxin WrbA